KDDPESMISMADGTSGAAETSNIVRDYSASNGRFQDALRYSCPGNYLHDLLHNICRADNTSDYCEYAKGTFYPNTGEFTLDETNGFDFRSTFTHGSKSTLFWADACYVGTYYNGDIIGPTGPPEVHLGKATKEWSI